MTRNPSICVCCKSALILTIVVFLSSCSSHTVLHPDTTAALEPVVRDENNPGIDRHVMLQAVMGLMSTPYKYQGDDDSGMDCSGFTGKIYADVVRRILPHSTREQFELGLAVPSGEIKFGDLLFFQLEGTDPSHVGIYVGDGLFAHASVSHGVTISLLENSYYRGHFIGARRIIP